MHTLRAPRLSLVSGFLLLACNGDQERASTAQTEAESAVAAAAPAPGEAEVVSQRDFEHDAALGSPTVDTRAADPTAPPALLASADATALEPADSGLTEEAEPLNTSARVEVDASPMNELDASTAESSIDASPFRASTGAAARDAASNPDATVLDEGLSDTELSVQVIARYRACGVLGEGPFQRRVDDSESRCQARCVLAAPCLDLRQSSCGERFAQPLLICSSLCSQLPPDGPVCGDGPILQRQVCDGWSDCLDGTDERNCPTHRCENGRDTTNRYARCDMSPDCTDGSDERGCAPFCPQRPDAGAAL